MNIDKNSHWYKNCKRQRSRGAKICKECPFKEEIKRFEEGKL
jgi:hypothetical protein